MFVIYTEIVVIKYEWIDGGLIVVAIVNVLFSVDLMVSPQIVKFYIWYLLWVGIDRYHVKLIEVRARWFANPGLCSVEWIR